MASLDTEELWHVLIERRAVVRYHRDQRLDDRCWADDYLVWNMLADTPSLVLPSFEEAMRRCREFYHYRREQYADNACENIIWNPLHWDDDLRRVQRPKLTVVLSNVQMAMHAHRDIFDRPRTVYDDRVLYNAILPEKVPADFRLPPKEDFLGEAKAPCAGCPSFWRSHLDCPNKKHDLHAWGPCV